MVGASFVVGFVVGYLTKSLLSIRPQISSEKKTNWQANSINFIWFHLTNFHAFLEAIFQVWRAYTCSQEISCVKRRNFLMAFWLSELNNMLAWFKFVISISLGDNVCGSPSTWHGRLWVDSIFKCFPCPKCLPDEWSQIIWFWLFEYLLVTSFELIRDEWHHKSPTLQKVHHPVVVDWVETTNKLEYFSIISEEENRLLVPY